MMMLELPEIVGRYARGLFPMEDGWYAADPRAVFCLEPSSLALVRRKLARSLKAADSFGFRLDCAFADVVASCARPRSRSDGVWLMPWIAEQYGLLHAAVTSLTVSSISANVTIPTSGRPNREAETL